MNAIVSGTKIDLRDSEIRYRRLFEAAQDGILILDAKTGMIEDVNPYLIQMLGYSREEFIKKKLWEVGAFRDIQASKDAFEALQVDEFIRYEDLPLKAKNGILVDVEFVSNVYLVGDEKVIQCNIRNITERKQAENALQASEAKFRRLVEYIPTVIYMNPTDDASSMNYISPQIKSLTGYTPEEWLQDSTLWLTVLYPEDIDSVLAHISRTDQHSAAFDLEYRITQRGGGLVWVRDQAALVSDPQNSHHYWQGIMVDITERKQAEEKIQRQLEHLIALSAVDRIIASNFDLKLSLSEILVYVLQELRVDAADILIFDSNMQMLEYGAERGFRTKSVRKAQVRFGESYAGRVALERQLVQIPNIEDEPHNLLLTKFLDGEDFVCYYGVPLIAKGQVKGVLEIFHRSKLNPDTEWIDFLHTLAGQVAIAAENAILFENLQRSNLKLTSAYDATIEGWSRALDLRDKETEGHSLRVTDMTVELARAFGLSDAELVQVRWGSLLHDIGKMGVPDGILLKPGALSDEEWIEMKKHPAFAYEMLSPIHYLRQALDIPYCHHEKWDGSGYPRGLKGDQIPLSARIFAVVDVWDALTSDRPYRTAWTDNETREYILSASGTHFEAQVVEKFMQVFDKV